MSLSDTSLSAPLRSGKWADCWLRVRPPRLAAQSRDPSWGRQQGRQGALLPACLNKQGRGKEALPPDPQQWLGRQDWTHHLQPEKQPRSLLKEDALEGSVLLWERREDGQKHAGTSQCGCPSVPGAGTPSSWGTLQAGPEPQAWGSEQAGLGAYFTSTPRSPRLNPRATLGRMD